MSDQIIIKGTGQPTEDQNHVNEMIKKVDDVLNQDQGQQEPNTQQQQDQPQQQQEPPKVYAGKYKTVEELERGYLELQKLASRKGIQTNNDKEQPKDNQQPQQQQDSQSEVKEILDSVGLDFDKYTDEVLADGVLSEDSYQELEAKGFPRNVVDAYIEGQKALAERTNQSIYEIVGGKEAYTEMIQWAAQNLSQEEIEAYNSTLESGNVSQIKIAVKGLKASYTEAKGTPPKQLIGGYSSGDVDVFESWAQVVEAMKDPKYDKDPAYRAAIQAKLGRSKNLM